MNEQNKRIDFDDNGVMPADEYENLAKKFIPGYDGLYSLAEVLLAENLRDAPDILVVGAGGGKEILTFGRAFSNANLTGVDPSEKMLDVARQLVEKANFQSRVVLHHGTIDDLDEKQFDAGSAMLVMHFLPDDGQKLEFLKAIHRRLKPGAKFILADGCIDKNSADFEWLMNGYKNHAKLNGAPPEIIEQAVKMITENVNTVSETRELELLNEANFGETRGFFQGLWVKAWITVRL